MSGDEYSLTTDRGAWSVEAEPSSRIDGSRFDELMAAARAVRDNAYAPYSRFRVGSAVLMDGEIATGCNVENASYGGTLCAERVAVSTAVAAGHRRLQLVAVSTDASGEDAIENRSPCGLCRQFLSEFADANTLVLLDGGSSPSAEIVGNVIPFDALLPWRFRLGESS
jgi:cytidine deaminase